MLTHFAYSLWDKLLATRCERRGIECIHVNPAYSSLIGLTKFMQMYGLSSDTAAALVIARRAMRLSESLPDQFASLVVRTRKHVWSSWYRLNRKLKGIPRHRFYGQLTVANRIRHPCPYKSCLTDILSLRPSGEVAKAPRDDQKGLSNEVQEPGVTPGDNPNAEQAFPSTAVSAGCLENVEYVQVCLSLY